MSKTTIYTTRKLEKTIKEYIIDSEELDDNYLGEWLATIFYVSRKKCWLMINKKTKYLLILSNIKKAQLVDISQIFKKTLYLQFVYEGITIDYEALEEIVGELKFHETNNDRSSNGSLNSSLLLLDQLIEDFDDFENVPFRELNQRLNETPNKVLNWSFPQKIMNEMIKNYVEKRAC